MRHPQNSHTMYDYMWKKIEPNIKEMKTKIGENETVFILYQLIE